jgi:hypothetical protein
MKTNYFPFLLLAQALLAEEAFPDKKNVPAAAVSSTQIGQQRSLYVIDPKIRAADYVQAYDFLRKDKPTLKIRILLLNGMELSNVTELSTTQGGTLLIAKYLSNQGTKAQIVAVEEIGDISYSPA